MLKRSVLDKDKMLSAEEQIESLADILDIDGLDESIKFLECTAIRAEESSFIGNKQAYLSLAILYFEKHKETCSPIYLEIGQLNLDAASRAWNIENNNPDFPTDHDFNKELIYFQKEYEEKKILN